MSLVLDAPQKYQEGEDFELWLDGFELYVCAVGVIGIERKRALLLHILGKEVQQKVKALGNGEANENDDVYERTKNQLKVLFAPKTRPVFERNVFHSMRMTDKDEDVVEFVGRLRKQAQRCQFGEQEGEDMIRDLVIAKCPYPGLQVRLLEADNLSLSQVVKMWKSHLQVREQAAKLQGMCLQEEKPPVQEEPQPEEVCRVQTSQNPKWRTTRHDGRRNQVRSERPMICFRCGEEGHKASQCQVARGQTCSKCGGRNHLAKACRSRMDPQNPRRRLPQVNTVEEDFVFAAQGPKETALVTVLINKQPVKVLVDTGASVDIMARSDFGMLKGIQVRKTNRRLMPYGTDIPLALDGQFVATTSIKEKQVEACWVIAAKGKVSLLSGATA